MEEISFPRGKVERPTDEVHQKNDADFSKDDHGKKKRRATEGMKSDFLFGRDDLKKERKSAKRAKTTEKQSQNDNLLAGVVSSKSLLPLGGGGCVHPEGGKKGKKEGWIEPLAFKKLSKGFKLLGICREAHEDLAIFSLPNMWTGYMLREKGSPPLDKILTVNQIASVVIVKAVQETTPDGPRRRIQVSCNPELCNPTDLNVPDLVIRGQVLSVEDHGLLVDLGLKRKGFLPFSEIEGEYTVDEEDDDDDTNKLNNSVKDKPTRILSVNRMLDFVVRSKSDTKIIPLKLPSIRNIATMTIPPTYKLNLVDLQPGMLVKAIVERTVKNGLCVTFSGGIFRGAIELSHLGCHWMPDQKNIENTEWKNIFENEGRTLHARIVAVDPTTKIIRLSLQPHLVSLFQESVPKLPEMGSVVEGCTVIRVDTGAGAVLALPENFDSDENDTMECDSGGDDEPLVKPVSKSESYKRAVKVKAVYVHISKAMDELTDGTTPESAFPKKFAPMTTHTVRIVSTSNLVEGIASGAAAKSIVEAHVLTHMDLIPGRLYKQVPVCKQLESGGVLVDFGMGIRGLINTAHMFDQGSGRSDFRARIRKVKYAVGAKVDVRVLSVDGDTKKCLLTAKKLLVKADDEHIIASYEDVKIGQKAFGYVSKVDSEGLWITFFNKVFGRVTARSLLSEMGVENPAENYQIGDALECRVVNIIRRKRMARHSSVDYQDEAMVDENTPQDGLEMFTQLTLSLKVDIPEGEDLLFSNETQDLKDSMTDVHLQAGGVLPLKSMRVLELVNGKDKKEGFIPGHAIVSIKSKYLIAEKERSTKLPTLECKLPFDQLLDSYEPENIQSVAALDEFASKFLSIGKKINRKGIILIDPQKSGYEYVAGTGHIIHVSIRPKLVEVAEKQQVHSENQDDDQPVLPDPETHIYTGAILVGYVVQLHKNHGAFIRFLNNMTGLVPKSKGGHLLSTYSTVTTKVIAVDDTIKPPKILLSLLDIDKALSKGIGSHSDSGRCPLQPGEVIGSAEVAEIEFNRAHLKVLDAEHFENQKLKVFLHCAMADSSLTETVLDEDNGNNESLPPKHPFYGWAVGTKLSNLTVISVKSKGRSWTIQVTNRSKLEKVERSIINNEETLQVGANVSGIVASMARDGGLWVHICHWLSAHVPPLEMSKDLDVLNRPLDHFPLGSRVKGVVIDNDKIRRKYAPIHRGKEKNTFMSLLPDPHPKPPQKGDLAIGHVCKNISVHRPPALMLELRGGFVGRCCITELDEIDAWVNMPIGRACSQKQKINRSEDYHNDGRGGGGRQAVEEKPDRKELRSDQKFVLCRVLELERRKSLAEVSLRPSRIKGDLDDDKTPRKGDIVPAYVVNTTNKGCFLRLSRRVEGRTFISELSNGFFPDPSKAFPPGRLVVCKVKNIEQSKHIKYSTVIMKADLDMRESSLIDKEKIVQFESISIGSRHRGTVERIEAYGVFVRIDGSEVTGLVHKSECSDSDVKNFSDLFCPGDCIEVVVLGKSDDKNQLSLSMKISGSKKGSKDSSVDEDG